MRRNLKNLTFAAGMLLLALPALAGVGTENTLKHSFRVSPGGIAHVRTEIGSIEVTTHAGNTVEAQVIRRVPSEDKAEVQRVLENFDVDFEQKGNEVFVTAKRLNRGWMFRDSRLKVKVTLAVPRAFNVDLRTSGGNIGVADLTGQVDARTSGGNLKLGRINGPVEAKTSGGNIDLRESRGTVDIATSGGNITIGDVDGDLSAHTSGGNIKIESVAGRINAETSGGNISIDDARGAIDAETSGGDVVARLRAQPDGSSRLHTSGGSVTVYLASGIRVNVHAHSSGGGVHSDIPVTVEGKMDRGTLNGKINGGGPDLVLSTSGGAVEIKNL